MLLFAMLSRNRQGSTDRPATALLLVQVIKPAISNALEPSAESEQAAFGAVLPAREPTTDVGPRRLRLLHYRAQLVKRKLRVGEPGGYRTGTGRGDCTRCPASPGACSALRALGPGPLSAPAR